MYDCYANKLASTYRKSFPLYWIIGENILHVTSWILAGALLWPLKVSGWPVATIVWAIFTLVVQILLKKHNCSGCYYYGKACHLGWGKIAARMFPQNSGDPKFGMKLAFPFYVISPPLILLASIAMGFLLDVGLLHWVFLVSFVVLGGISFPIRTKGCKSCAMRKVCPGSAWKKD